MCVGAGTLIPGLAPGPVHDRGRRPAPGRAGRADRPRRAAPRRRGAIPAAAAEGFDSGSGSSARAARRGGAPAARVHPIEAGRGRSTLRGEDAVRPVGDVALGAAAPARVCGCAAAPGSRRAEGGERPRRVGEGDWLVAEERAEVRGFSTEQPTCRRAGAYWEAAALARAGGRARSTLGIAQRGRGRARADRRRGRPATPSCAPRPPSEFAALMEPLDERARQPAARAIRCSPRCAWSTEHLGVEARRPPPSAAARAARRRARRDRARLRPVLRARSRCAASGGRRTPGADRLPRGRLPGGARPRSVRLRAARPGHRRGGPRQRRGRSQRLQPHGRGLYRQLPDRPMTGASSSARATQRYAGATSSMFLVAAFAVAGLEPAPGPDRERRDPRHPDPQRRETSWSRRSASACSAPPWRSRCCSPRSRTSPRCASRASLQAQIQEGIWGRIMRLSPAFFRRYSTGDLATRALALDAGAGAARQPRASRWRWRGSPWSPTSR